MDQKLSDLITEALSFAAIRKFLRVDKDIVFSDRVNNAVAELTERIKQYVFEHAKPKPAAEFMVKFQKLLDHPPHLAALTASVATLIGTLELKPGTG